MARAVREEVASPGWTSVVTSREWVCTMEGIAADKARSAMSYFLQRLQQAPSARRKVLSSLLLEASEIACRECASKNCEQCLAVKAVAVK